MVVKKEMVLGCVHDYRLCVIGLILTIFLFNRVIRSERGRNCQNSS